MTSSAPRWCSLRTTYEPRKPEPPVTTTRLSRQKSPGLGQPRSVGVPFRDRSSVTEWGRYHTSNPGGWAIRALAELHELDLPAGVQTHPQQDQAFPDVLDVRAAVIALIVANRDFDDVQVELRGAEEQVEVAKRVEIAKESPSRRDLLVVAPPERLGAAQCVLEGLAEQIAEGCPKEFVGEGVEQRHRAAAARIDQPAAVGELSAPADDDVEKLGQVLWRHRQVRVEDHQHVAARHAEALAHGIALPLARLFEDLDVPVVAVGLGDPLDLLEG